MSGAFGLLGAGGSLGHAPYRIGGVVRSPGSPLAGVMIVVDPTRDPRVLFSNATGAFEIPGLSDGAHLIQFSQPGYETTNLTIFLSTYYVDPGNNLTDLIVGMVPGNSSASWSPGYSEFPDLETFVALMYSSSVMEAFGGLVAIWGGVCYYRRRSVPRFVVGGMSALLTPLFPFLIGTSGLYFELPPEAGLVAAGSALLGLIVLLFLGMSYRGLPADYN